jgi:hypothetical protein
VERLAVEEQRHIIENPRRLRLQRMRARVQRMRPIRVVSHGGEEIAEIDERADVLRSELFSLVRS